MATSWPLHKKNYNRVGYKINLIIKNMGNELKKEIYEKDYTKYIELKNKNKLELSTDESYELIKLKQMDIEGCFEVFSSESIKQDNINKELMELILKYGYTRVNELCNNMNKMSE